MCMGESFREFALSSQRTEAEQYAIQQVIDFAMIGVEGSRSLDWEETRYNHADVAAAEDRVAGLEWLSFQRLGRGKTPVDLSVLRFTPGLTGLALNDSGVADISVLEGCPRLKRLHLNDTLVTDVSVLRHCPELSWLSISDLKVDDLSVLAGLTKLKRLEITIDQAEVLGRVDCLSSVEELILWAENIDYGAFDNAEDIPDAMSLKSLEVLPDMPELRMLANVKAGSLQGIQRFRALENISNLSGGFTSLEPLKELEYLISANFDVSGAIDLSPLAGLHRLRYFGLFTEAETVDLEPLYQLPALYNVRVKCDDKEPADLAKLRASLTSADGEFFVQEPKSMPALDMQMISIEEYEKLLDAALNVDKPWTALVEEEQTWVNKTVEAMLPPKWEESEDYVLAFPDYQSRVMEYVLFSRRAEKRLHRVCEELQEFLCRAKNDWLIRVIDSEGNYEFLLYADKVLLCADSEAKVKKLLSKRGFFPW